MPVKEFSIVTVYSYEAGSFGSIEPEVAINWSSIGSVPLSRARDFHRALGEAIAFAEGEEQRMRGEG